MKKHEAGFSMVELMIVCVIMVIIAALAIPNIFRTYQNYQLDSAGHSVASLLQQARMQAVKTNQPVYVNYDNNALPNVVYATDAPGKAYASGNPDVAISAALSFQPPPTAAFHAQLDAYITGTPQPGATTGTIGFNARGLPCVAGANPAVCNLPLGISGFEWFMQSNGGWEAVTVSSSGRIKTWRMNGQTGGTTNWQ
jgi:prepilin-type N-terminal cleavage/methylation domain-containing protein